MSNASTHKNQTLPPTQQIKKEQKIAYLTDSVKSPGFDLLGRARKLPSKPLSINNASASIPLTLGWNHLEIEKLRIWGTWISFDQLWVMLSNFEELGVMLHSTSALFLILKGIMHISSNPLARKPVKKKKKSPISAVLAIEKRRKKKFHHLSECYAPELWPNYPLLRSLTINLWGVSFR